MKKATLVLATAVAFLLSGPVFAARKVVDMPTTGTILSGSTSTLAENGILKVSGAALEGEFIPGVKNALAIVPETKIASSAISGLAKNVVKGGIAGLALGAAFDAMIDGVGWIEGEGGKIQKPGAPGGAVDTTSGQYQWVDNGVYWPSAEALCSGGVWRVKPLTVDAVSTTVSGASVSCRIDYSDPNGGKGYTTFGGDRTGNGCPANTTYSATKGACLAAGSLPVALTDSDLGVLDGFVQGKDGVWQRDLTTELCGSNENCYKGLNPDTSLTGPAKVTGTPTTVTTTNSSGSQSTSVQTPTTTITYGPNYYDYSTSTTTTTNNNGGDTTTTVDDTDTSMPVPPNILGGANGGLGGIRDGIPTTASSTSPIPYMAWWSFDQSCTEITFVIPVRGPVTTAMCPVYKQYIWPILYFFFAVYTWHSCFEIWRKTIMRVRAS